MAKKDIHREVCPGHGVYPLVVRPVVRHGHSPAEDRAEEGGGAEGALLGEGNQAGGGGGRGVPGAGAVAGGHAGNGGRQAADGDLTRGGMIV